MCRHVDFDFILFEMCREEIYGTWSESQCKVWCKMVSHLTVIFIMEDYNMILE